MRRRNSAIEGMRCAARSRIVHPSTSAWLEASLEAGFPTRIASLGAGAFLNGLPISVSCRDELSSSLWGIGFAYDPHRRDEQAKFYDRVMTHIRDVRRMGSAALDLCRVACGQLDGYWEFQLNAWDLAAGGIIAREAGAVTRGFHGYTFEQGYVLASTPALSAPMLAVLDRYR